MLENDITSVLEETFSIVREQVNLIGNEILYFVKHI